MLKVDEIAWNIEEILHILKKSIENRGKCSKRAKDGENCFEYLKILGECDENEMKIV